MISYFYAKLNMSFSTPNILTHSLTFPFLYFNYFSFCNFIFDSSEIYFIVR